MRFHHHVMAFDWRCRRAVPICGGMDRRILGIFAATCLLLAAATGARAGEDRLAVVELFTSQGCSSCPPADALLTDLAGRDDVLALSYHVNYWDYIGWRDNFALPANTDRQRTYAKRFGRSYVYTPQMVINGAAETTGRSRQEVLDLLADSDAGPVPVSLTRAADGGMKVSVGASGQGGDADVWLVFFDRSRDVTIKRGENAGRTIRYTNVVRRMERIGSWSGEAADIPVASGDMPGEACAVLLQARDGGRILGAARLLPRG